jgi:YegS/Rv2252/BmrU family lipid kinase
MRSQPKSRTLAKTLKRKQREHEEQLARVEKAASRLQRRKARLLSIEAQMATLERRMAQPLRAEADKGAITGFRDAQLIFNPAAGRDPEHNALRLAKVVSGLRAHGIEPRIGVKTSGKAAREIVREARKSRMPLVVVAAGDGTIEEVASQLIGSDVVLGIIPLGTMNNLARCLGIPLEIEEACALIGMGATRHIDVGHIVSSDKPHVTYFLEGAGTGLSAIAALTGQNIEKHEWRMVPRALRKFFETKPGIMKVDMDEKVVEAATQIVTASNAPMMGKNMMVAPGAKMDDGMLDVVLYDGMGEAALVKHFMAAANGSPDELPVYRARRVRITTDQPVHSHADKDLHAKHRVVEMEILPRSLTVVAGNGIGLSMPVESAPSVPAKKDEKPDLNGASAEWAKPAAEPSRT